MWSGEGVSDLVTLQCGIHLRCLVRLLSATARTSKREAFTGLSVIFLMPWRKWWKSITQQYSEDALAVSAGPTLAVGGVWPENFPIWARENVSPLTSIQPSRREPGTRTWPRHSLHASFLLSCPVMSLSPEKPHSTDGGKTLNHFLFQKSTSFLLL